MLHWIRVLAVFCATLAVAPFAMGQAPPVTAPVEAETQAPTADGVSTTEKPAEAEPAPELPSNAPQAEVPSTAQVEDEASVARARARLAYAEGEKAFTEGRYEAALAAFLRAYQTLPNPVVLLSVAETERRLGRVDAAITHLTTFLEAAAPGDPRRPQVQADIDVLRAMPATVVVRSEPAGAVVSVEGQPDQVVAPGQLSLPAGKHVLLVQMPGRETVRTPVALDPGTTREVTVTLSPVAPEPAVQARDDDEVAIWVAAGVGTAGLVAGSVLGFMALSENSDYDRNPSPAAADRGERLALFADVALGVGAMGFITAAVMFFTDDAPDDSEPAADSAMVPTFRVMAGADGAMGVARMRF